MYRIASASLISSVAALGLAGCLAVHAELPEEVISSIQTRPSYHDMCVHAGEPYSEGSSLCLDRQRLRCHHEQWVRDGEC